MYEDLSLQELRALLMANERARSDLQSTLVQAVGALDTLDTRPWTGAGWTEAPVFTPVASINVEQGVRRQILMPGHPAPTVYEGQWKLTAMLLGLDALDISTEQNVSPVTGLVVPPGHQWGNPEGGCVVQQDRDRVGFYIDSTRIPNLERPDGGQALEWAWSPAPKDYMPVVSDRGTICFDLTLDYVTAQINGKAVVQIAVWGFFRNRRTGHTIAFVVLISDNRSNSIEDAASTDTNWWFWTCGWGNTSFTKVPDTSPGRYLRKPNGLGPQRYRLAVTPEGLKNALDKCAEFCRAHGGTDCETIGSDPADWDFTGAGFSMEMVFADRDKNKVLFGCNVRGFQYGYRRN